MGGGAPTFEQSGLGQQERTAAHRRGAPGFGGRLFEPVDQAQGVVHRQDNRRGTGNDQRVDRLVIEGAQGHGVDGQALCGVDQAAVQAGGLQGVAGQIAAVEVARGRPEHGLCAGQVEQAHFGVGEEDNQARLVGR